MATRRTKLLRAIVAGFVVATAGVALFLRPEGQVPPDFLKDSKVLWRQTSLTTGPAPAPAAFGANPTTVAQWTEGTMDGSRPSSIHFAPSGDRTYRTVAYLYKGSHLTLGSELSKFKPGKDKWLPLIEGLTFWTGSYLVLSDHHEAMVEWNTMARPGGIEVVITQNEPTTLLDRFEGLIRGGYRHPAKDRP